LDSFFRTLISLFLSIWYHISFWILLFFCHNTSSKYMKSLRFLGCRKPSRWPMVSSFFFGKLTYVLKEEDTKIIRGRPQIYNENRNIKQQMATG
jgi:hypothetical protein